MCPVLCHFPLVASLEALRVRNGAWPSLNLPPGLLTGSLGVEHPLLGARGLGTHPGLGTSHAPCSIPCHLPAAPACPRTAAFTRRQTAGEMQPPGGPGCLSPPWSGHFLSDHSHPSRGCPSGLCLGFPASSFWSLCAIFRQSQGKGALPQNIPSLQRGAGHREHPGEPLPAPHPSGKVGEQREKPHFGGA